MKRFDRTISLIAPSIVIGSLLFFGYYSLVIYKPSGHVACYHSMVARQTDVAVNVVRQWFGLEGDLYTACPASNG
jgi:hypothetical protein